MNKKQCQICQCTDEQACDLGGGRPCDWISTPRDVWVCSHPRCVREYHEQVAMGMVDRGRIADGTALSPPPRPIAFFVEGKPKGSGSKTAIVARNRAGKIVFKNGRPVVSMVDGAGLTTEGKREVRDWKRHIVRIAELVMAGDDLITGPIGLEIWFFIQRPKGHRNAGGTLRPSAPAVPTVKPDVTKLLRRLEDTLTGIVWADDNQVVDQQTHKRYAVAGRTGAVVIVKPLIF